MLWARLPELTNRVEAILNANPQECFRDLDEATGILDRSGFVGRPVRPPQPSGVEPGEWQHGLVLERLRMPHDVTEARCECGVPLDVFGRHRAACPRSRGCGRGPWDQNEPFLPKGLCDRSNENATSREVSPILRGSAFFAWLMRWQRMLSVSCARAFACSLVRSRSEGIASDQLRAKSSSRLFHNFFHKGFQK